MKHLIAFILFLISINLNAQNETYLLFEWMVVDNEQSSDYMDIENFWEKIHDQRVKSGEIEGWDLWSLQPGGEWQDFQYLTVHVYSDPVAMMEGPSWNTLSSAAKKAYPNMSEDDIMKKLNHSAKTRDLAVRQYMVEIVNTDDDFKMPLGTVARINMMKTEAGGGNAYVEAETKYYLPLHQKAADNGHLGSWGLASVMLPSGSDIYANYLTFDMWENYKHMFDSPTPWEDVSEEEMKMLNKASETRDLKKTYLGTLIKKIR